MLFPEGRLDNINNKWTYEENEDQTVCLINVATNTNLIIDENGFTATGNVDCRDESAKFSIYYIDVTTEEEEDGAVTEEEEDVVDTEEEDAVVTEEEDTSNVSDSFSIEDHNYNIKNLGYNLFLKNDNTIILWGSYVEQPFHIFSSGDGTAIIQFATNGRYVSNNGNGIPVALSNYQSIESDWVITEVSTGVYCF